VAATGPAEAAGPATTCGAWVASGAGACATGFGESNTGALTGALTPADGVVPAPVGSVVGAIGAGGTAPAALEIGAPDSSPLSKVRINSPGVTLWAGPVGASGVPGTGVAAAPEIDGVATCGETCGEVDPERVR
jgi:hypothetical protein